MKHPTDKGQRLLSRTLDWPDSWKGDRADVPIGTGILNAVTPFLQSLVDSGLSPTTLSRHFSNIWLLGGEIIRQSSYDSSLRSLPGQDILLHYLHEDGGPLSKHISTDAEQKSFDSSCRKLYQFFLAQSNEKQ